MPIDVNQLIARAKSQLGVKYSWGGGGPSGTGYGFAQGAGTKGFDCSSFMQYVFAGFGVKLPRVTYDQVRQGAQVSYKNLKAGDLMFFNQGSRGPEHVGLYIGNGKFIHAPKTGDVIKISSAADPYYRSIFTGGRRVANVSGGGEYDPVTATAGNALAAAMDNPAPASPEDQAAEYGWSYNFLQSDPELKNTFKQAVGESWSAGRFQAEIRNTNWWKSHSEKQREAIILEKTDPSTYKANLQATRDSLYIKARELGAIVSEAQLGRMSEDAYRSGWTEEQVNSALVNLIKFTDDKVLGGRAGQIEKFARELSARNGVQLGDQTIRNYAVKIIRGDTNIDQFENYIRQQAASAFPAFSKQIMGGEDVEDIAMSYKDSMAKILELSPKTLTVFDPNIKKAMNFKDAAGDPVGMGMQDFENMMRNDPRWAKTAGARDQLVSAGQSVLKNFGLMN